LAYNQWREQYQKGDFDDDRYDAFKANYEVLTVANVIAAKEARESGESRERLELDEFADTVGIISVTEPVNVDLSIEYDAAAKLAYNQWREQYQKGDFDDDRYDAFKANYEVLTVANVIAAKEARESGESRERLEFNEFADFTTEEYMVLSEGTTEALEETKEAPEEAPLSVMGNIMESSNAQNEAANAIEEATAAMAEDEQKLAEMLGLESVEDLEAAIDGMDGIAEDGGELDPANTSEDTDVRSMESLEETKEAPEEAPLSVMGNIMESSAAQNEAANAIEEATAAMAEDEQKLAEKLGLESVEDLEAAIDGMDGIAEDGGELDPANTSEDTDVRSAYINWCKEFGQETDESRYPTFMFNYLAMENLANESGKAMELNIYADFSEEEFIAVRSKDSSVVDTDAEKVAESNSKIDVATEADVEVASNVNTEVNAEEKEEAEVDVRSAYIDWCKEFGKEIDESRYPAFSSNYLALDQYAKESGKKMQLNMYADYTEEEFITLGDDTSPAIDVDVEKVDESKSNNEAVSEAEVAAEVEASAEVKAEEDADTEAIAEANADESKSDDETVAEVEVAAEVEASTEVKAEEDADVEATTEANTREEAANAEVDANEEVEVEVATEVEVTPDVNTEEDVDAKVVAETNAKEEAAIARAKAKAEEDADVDVKAVAETNAKEEAAIARAKAKVEEDAAIEETKAQEEAANAEARANEKASAIALAEEEAATEAKQRIKEAAAANKAKEIVAEKTAAITQDTAAAQKKTQEANIEKIAAAAAKRAEVSKVVEEDKKKRHSAQDKALADAKAAAEAAAIASAKEVGEIDAIREAKTREFDDLARELILKEAKEADEKLASSKITDPIIPVRKPASEPKGVTTPKWKQRSPEPARETASKNISPVTEEKSKPFWLKLIKKVQNVDDDSSTETKRATSAPARKPVTKTDSVSSLKKKVAPKKVAPKKPAPSPSVKAKSLFSTSTQTKKKPALFTKKILTPKEVQSTSAPKKAAKPKKKTSPPAQKKSSGTFTIKTSQGKGNQFGVKTKVAASIGTKPVGEKGKFSIFGKKETPKKVSKTPVAAKATTPAKKRSWGTFSIKSATESQAKSKAATPAKKGSWGTFSIKSATESQAKSKTATPAKKSSWGTFNIKSATESQTKSKTATPAKKSSWGTLNIKSATKTKVKPKAAPAQKSSRGTLNIKSATKTKVKPKAAPASKLVSKNDPFSFFKSKPAAKDDIPIISNWERAADGSITGQISNSPNFRNGETITTSPARGVATADKVVVTGSGSKYRLRGEPKSVPGKKKKFLSPAKSAPKDGIPIISNWERESDGSITGQISNSPNFRNGETITTSPARGVARSGKVVVTGSGSKYRLM